MWILWWAAQFAGFNIGSLLWLFCCYNHNISRRGTDFNPSKLRFSICLFEVLIPAFQWSLGFRRRS